MFLFSRLCIKLQKSPRPCRSCRKRPDPEQRCRLERRGEAKLVMWSDEEEPKADGSAVSRGMWSDSDVEDQRGHEDVAPDNQQSAADKLRANVTRARAAKQKRLCAKAGLMAEAGFTAKARSTGLTAGAKADLAAQGGSLGEDKINAIRKLFSSGFRASGRETARALSVDRRFLDRATIVAAAWAIEEEASAFEDLLADVEVGKRAARSSLGIVCGATCMTSRPLI